MSTTSVPNRFGSALPAPETPAENRARLVADRCVPSNKPKGGNYDRQAGSSPINRAFVKKDGQW